MLPDFLGLSFCETLNCLNFNLKAYFNRFWIEFDLVYG